MPPSSETAGAPANTARLPAGARCPVVAKRVRLGQLLTEAGHLTPKQLDQALTQQKQTGERLGELVVSLGFASPEHIASALARQLNLRFIRLDDTVVQEAPLARVPGVRAQRYRGGAPAADQAVADILEQARRVNEDRDVEITEGLCPGDQVVTDGNRHNQIITQA